MSRRPTARLVTALAGVVVAAGLVVAAPPSPASALDSPSSLAATDAPIPVLSWDRVVDSTQYEVQLSRTSDFATTLASATTVNDRYVPLVQLPTGEVWWRVRAKTSPATSDWTGSSFTLAPPSAPTLVQPLPDATFTPPHMPRFTWEPVAGATSYTVQTSPDPAFTDVTLIAETTGKSTAAYLTNYPDVGVYHWRVRAELSPGYYTAWSEPQPYRVAGLPAAVRTAPADVFDKDTPGDVFVTDVVLDWEPVPGAATYDLRLGTDRNFLSSTLEVSAITGTRYSPPTTLANDDYFWQVRPVFGGGQAAPWPDTPWRFTKAWPDRITPVYPIGTPSATDPFFFQWQPMERASSYKISVWDNSKPATTPPCQATALITMTVACKPTVAGTYRWRVDGIDDPSGVPTVFRASETVTFTYEPPPAATTDPLTAVTGESVAMTGTAAFGLAGATRQRCDDEVPSQCDDLRQTPILTWDPVPGATSYNVVISNDAEGTNLHSTITGLTQPLWTPPTSFADSQAGSAYYWKVVPCRGATCLDPITFDHAFAKESIAPKPLSPTGGVEVANDVRLDWSTLTERYDDADVLLGSDLQTPAEMVAKQYIVQTSQFENFSSLIEAKTVDQTTFTSFATTYPEGPVFWRVAAIDSGNRQTVWSETARFVKRSPRPTLVAPLDGAPLGQDSTLTWEPLDFAKSYDVEVWSSPTTRVSTANTSHVSWTPSTPFPAATTDYTWRVRRIDAAGRPGDWTDFRRFSFNGFAPSLSTPAAGAVVPPSSGLFTWEPDPRATSYRFERRKPGSATDIAETVTTRATAYAPTAALAAGTSSWRVTALDVAGRTLGSSPWREFVVVDPPATTTPVTISGSGRVGTELRLSAPTFDPAAESTTYQWFRGTSAVTGATGETFPVTSADVGKVITVKATGALNGYKSAVSTSNAITGAAGEALVATAPPTIEGDPLVGQILSVTGATWPETPASRSYQWYRDGVAIFRADDPTYRLTAEDLDRDVSVIETGAVAGRANGTSASDPVLVMPTGTLTPTSEPTLSGTPTVGQTLQATPGVWNAPANIRYQWLRNGAAISGATSSSYVLAPLDAGRRVQARVVASASGWAPGSATTVSLPVAKLRSTTALTLSRTRATTRQRVTATVTVSVSGLAPGGTVSVYDGTRRLVIRSLGTRTSTAVALPLFTAGAHTIRAVYSGGPQVAGSARSVRLTVTR